MIAALTDASDALVPATGRLARFMRPSSARADLASKLVAALADCLPVNLRDQFASAAAFEEGEDPARWACWTGGLLDLVDAPERALEALDDAGLRQV